MEGLIIMAAGIGIVSLIGYAESKLSERNIDRTLTKKPSKEWA